MLTNVVPNQLAKVLAGESVSSPVYLGVGTGTSVESADDTSLGVEVFRISFNSFVSNVNAVKSEAEIAGLNVGYQGSFREFGVLDESVDGNLYSREVTDSAVVINNTGNLKVTKYTYFGNSNNAISVINENLTMFLCDFFEGTTGTSPSHIVFSSYLVLDKCDSLGSNPNDWQNSADASSAVLNEENFVEGTGSIDMGKDGTSSAVAYYERTLASEVDITGMTQLRVRINILDGNDLANLKSVDCLKIWIGNDSSNYYEVSFDRDELIAGWQELIINISDMVETGSVTDSGIDYLRLTWETTNSSDTINSGDLMMDYWCCRKNLSDSDVVLIDEQVRKAFSESVSVVDNLVKFKAVIGISEGNTYIYNLFGLFNAGSGGSLFYALETLDAVKDSKVSLTCDLNVRFTIKFWS
jgi:hypothetical protein